MQLKTKVKVGNITNLSDARYCAGMGVDLLGFPIGDADGQIPFDIFREIAGWVSGPTFVLEYSDTMNEAELQQVTESTAIQYIQLNYEQLSRLGSKIDLPIILNSNIPEWLTIKDNLVKYDISYLALSKDNSVNWKQMEEINKKVKILIPYTQIEDIEEIKSLPITGILLEGSSEDKPGQKDYDHLATALESLEVY